ncbi:hypothetical protein [Olivibacter jilunii]|uniref:hypothetical protein n=1 Tax=Olivibacter jilunii TaxID=985016 RepID=UPI0010308B15|nr:hypothetical protein [Olivibacter jilunii]
MKSGNPPPQIPGIIPSLEHAYSTLSPIIFEYHEMYCCYYGKADAVMGFGADIEQAIEDWHRLLCKRVFNANIDDMLAMEIVSKLNG